MATRRRTSGSRQRTSKIGSAVRTSAGESEVRRPFPHSFVPRHIVGVATLRPRPLIHFHQLSTIEVRHRGDAASLFFCVIFGPKLRKKSELSASAHFRPPSVQQGSAKHFGRRIIAD